MDDEGELLIFERNKIYFMAECHQSLGDRLEALSKNLDLPISKIFSNQDRIRKRFVQLILADNFDKLVKYSAQNEYSEQGIRIQKNFYLDELSLDFELKKIEFKKIILFKHFMRTILVWSYLLLYALFGFISFMFTKKKKKEKQHNILAFSIPLPKDLTEATLQPVYDFFLKHFPALRENRIVYIEKAEKNENYDDRFEFCRRPLLKLLQNSIYSFSDYINFFRCHFACLIEYLIFCLKDKKLILLGKDYALAGAAKYLDRKYLDLIYLITISNFLNQPLWMTSIQGAKTKLHMVWYSTNAKGVFFVEKPKLHFPHYFPFRFMTYDVGWYWTNEQANWAELFLGQHENHVVGPIIIKESFNSNFVGLSDDRLLISLFDVTPTNKEWCEKNGLIYNYYSPEVIMLFLEDVIEIAKEIISKFGVRLEVLLKHKRPPGLIHDSKYLDVIEKLVKENDFFSLVSPHYNIFEMVNKSDISVVVPYSSPAYIASSLLRDAVFYDSSEDLIPCFDAAPGVSFCSGKAELKKYLFAKVREKFHFNEE